MAHVKLPSQRPSPGAVGSEVVTGGIQISKLYFQAARFPKQPKSPHETIGQRGSLL